MLKKLLAVSISAGVLAGAAPVLRAQEEAALSVEQRPLALAAPAIGRSPAEEPEAACGFPPKNVDPLQPEAKRQCPFKKPKKFEKSRIHLPEDRFKNLKKKESKASDSGAPPSIESAAAEAGRRFDRSEARGGSPESFSPSEESSPALSRPSPAAVRRERGAAVALSSTHSKTPAAAPKKAPGFVEQTRIALKAAVRALAGGAASPAALSERLTLAAQASRAPASESSDDGSGKKVKWGVEVFTGDAYNFPMPLAVRQNGQPDINMTAKYDTHPFDFHAPYYAWRISRWEGDSAWEFEHIHTKLVLANTTPEIQDFAISHGYNYVLVNRAMKAGGLIWRLGGGVIITHPESTVRGQTLDEDNGGNLGAGYSISGVGAQAAVEKRVYLTPNFFAQGEVKLTAGYADVRVSDGDATAPALSLHALIGIGAEF